MRNRIPLALLDILVGMFLVVLIGAITISASHFSRDAANKAKCASNLHQIGLAILLYQNDNFQMYPRTVMDGSDDPKPTWGTPYEADKKIGAIPNIDPFGGAKGAPADNDVTAAFFLLMRNEQITSALFVCPQSKAEPFDFDDGSGGALSGQHNAQEWTNWRGNEGLLKNLSYSYENPYGGKAAVEAGFQLKTPDATYAIAADMNPGGDAVTSVTINTPPDQMKTANSQNHDGDGQNVLYGDGHVEFLNNPFCGTQHDNIYTAAGPEIEETGRKTAVVVASPTSNTDSILLPTTSDITVKSKAKPKPVAVVAAVGSTTDLLGTYTAEFPGHHMAVLTVDDKTFKCVVGPATVIYHYEITGNKDGVIQLNLTAPDIKTTATATLHGKDLKIDMSDEFSIDFPWRRTDPKHPTLNP